MRRAFLVCGLLIAAVGCGADVDEEQVTEVKMRLSDESAPSPDRGQLKYLPYGVQIPQGDDIDAGYRDVGTEPIVPNNRV